MKDYKTLLLRKSDRIFNFNLRNKNNSKLKLLSHVNLINRDGSELDLLKESTDQNIKCN